MNDLLTYDMIPIELRTANIGEYNRLVYICPECDNDMNDCNFEYAIGFGSIGGIPGRDVVMVVECNKCGIRYHSHAGKSTYNCFVNTKERLANQRRPNVE